MAAEVTATNQAPAPTRSTNASGEIPQENRSPLERCSPEQPARIQELTSNRDLATQL